jgi:hypothetical protein
VHQPARLPLASNPPIYEYDNSGATPACPRLGGFEGVSVIPGYVVRDRRLQNQLGRLLYTDIASTEIRSLIPTPSGALDDQSTGVPYSGGAYSFAEGFENRLFLIVGDGPVYRLDPA